MASPERDVTHARFRLAESGPHGLRWQLRRNCVLTPLQLLWAFALAGVAALAVAGFFWAMGARLVLPFAVLETAALGWAFLWYARHATDRETLVLDARRLVVECEQGGIVARHELPRPWLRVGDAGGLVELRAGAACIRVGRYARPEHRCQLVRELRLALGHPVALAVDA